MDDLNDLKNRILRIARNHKVDDFNPLNISELINELGEENRRSVDFALMSLMGEGKLGTRGTGNKLNIIRVSHLN